MNTKDLCWLSNRTWFATRLPTQFGCSFLKATKKQFPWKLRLCDCEIVFLIFYWYMISRHVHFIVTVTCGVQVNLYIGLSPHPATATTRIITFLVGNPYKPSFVTVTGRGEYPTYIYLEPLFDDSIFEGKKTLQMIGTFPIKPRVIIWVPVISNYSDLTRVLGPQKVAFVALRKGNGTPKISRK